MRYPFNVRVYGLLRQGHHLLVSDEMIRGERITKFPGGGLEYGEGLRACLRREIEEEIGVKATILEHFYTTDVFTESRWRPGDQIISVYYEFSVEDPSSVQVVDLPFEGIESSVEGKEEVFRWLDLRTATVEDLALPIDRLVLEMMLRED